MISRIAQIALLSVVFCLVAGASAYLTLTLIIKGEEPVIVPKLIGKDVIYALEFLSDLELNTKVRGSEYNPEIPKNHVVFQDPEPGAEIKKGRDVQIILSKGPPTVVIPDLRSFSLQETGIILEENDMCRGAVSHSYHSGFEKGHVIAQFPRAGTNIEKKTCLHLLVSMGKRPKPHMMPNLINYSVDDAILAIEKTNLALEQINHQYKKNKPRNTILGQSPRSGSIVTEGAPVSLVVNRNPERKVLMACRHFLMPAYSGTGLITGICENKSGLKCRQMD
jgi:beta-lactam-binding protein with PASTA domain